MVSMETCDQVFFILMQRLTSSYMFNDTIYGISIVYHRRTNDITTLIEQLLLLFPQFLLSYNILNVVLSFPDQIDHHLIIVERRPIALQEI